MSMTKTYAFARFRGYWTVFGTGGYKGTCVQARKKNGEVLAVQLRSRVGTNYWTFNSPVPPGAGKIPPSPYAAEAKSTFEALRRNRAELKTDAPANGQR